ncbi:MAG: alpha/beta hydrolase [Gemmatimonadota bacterium]
MADSGPDRKSIVWLVLSALGLLVAGLFAPWFRSRERAELDDDARERAPGDFVALPDGWTHYEELGPPDGQPVVLIHGFSVPAYVWDATVPALAEAGLRVIRYDVYGRGYSDRPRRSYDRNLFERQLVGLLEALGVERPADLVGLSMGGAIAAAVTDRYPHLVRRLVLIDPYAQRSPIGPLAIRGVGELLATTHFVPRLVRRQHRDVRDTPWYPRWVEAYREQVGYRGFRRALLGTARDFIDRDPRPLFEAAAARGKPTLLIWGEHDPTVPLAASVWLRELLEPEFLLVRGAGHVPHAQRPDVVNPVVVRFLADAPAGTR